MNRKAFLACLLAMFVPFRRKPPNRVRKIEMDWDYPFRSGASRLSLADRHWRNQQLLDLHQRNMQDAAERLLGRMMKHQA